MKRALLVLTVTAGIIGVPAVWLLWHTRPPVPRLAVISSPSPLPTIAGVRVEQIAGRSLAFAVSGPFALKRHDVTEESENIMLYSTDGHGTRLTVTDQPWTYQTIDDVPAVRWRQNRPETYTLAPIAVAGEAGLLATTKAESFERVVFLRHDTRLVTLALSAIQRSREAELTDQFDQLLTSLTWQ